MARKYKYNSLQDIRNRVDHYVGVFAGNNYLFSVIEDEKTIRILCKKTNWIIQLCCENKSPTVIKCVAKLYNKDTQGRKFLCVTCENLNYASDKIGRSDYAFFQEIGELINFITRHPYIAYELLWRGMIPYGNSYFVYFLHNKIKLFKNSIGSFIGRLSVILSQNKFLNMIRIWIDKLDHMN